VAFAVHMMMMDNEAGAVMPFWTSLQAF